ncbi:unnamed protein product [Triticum turgidum subsp. durum]|uniref:Protein EXORDIUM n=1 Tax=Triticum turgidum subsp. durum TaxID=4567 RepID=A0A9R0Y7L5_TRITD|nr:unnamed protein product [Triticum turgidum subsp. durum]
MAGFSCTSTSHAAVALVSVLLLSLAHGLLGAHGARRLMELYKPDPSELLTYHNGAVLQGAIPVTVLWYGRFTPAQKAVVSDFLLSLTAASPAPTPSVSQWWGTIAQLYLSKAKGANAKRATQVALAGQVSDERCSLGKSLALPQLAALAARAKPRKGGIALVLTAEDVAVEGFCRSRCGLHGSDAAARTAYVWVGNSASQCPGQCAWPFHKPAYGPQAPALVAPSGDVGMDGMVMNVASMVAGAVTNPATTGASYNANGANGRKYLLPALFDPDTSTCSTLV